MSFSRANALRATVSNAFSTLTPSFADVSKRGMFDFSKLNEQHIELKTMFTTNFYRHLPAHQFCDLRLGTYRNRMKIQQKI